MFPGDPGLRQGGLRIRARRAHEGGPRNGVLTAIEDFVAEREDVRLSWSRRSSASASYGTTGALGSRVARILDPFDRNPLLERLEANRVDHLAEANLASGAVGERSA